jgi:hypothetical protein
MRVFEHRVQRKMLGHKQSKVTSSGKKLNNEVLHYLCSLPDIITIRIVRCVMCMGEERSACRVLVRKPEGKRPFGRTKCRGEGNTNKMDLRVVG